MTKRPQTFQNSVGD